ncbi:unnamed protein product [Mytilus coruscus]|uniref:Uncharacterized protein n=1 Tax=Mytilus coruscus TaxID=42192 RepID=A0A6J8AQU8_MYTCO|nr:unnamed protein product [Mytilus coruscus]
MPISFPNVQIRFGNVMVPYDSVKLKFRQTPIPDLISTVLEYRLGKLKVNKGSLLLDGHLYKTCSSDDHQTSTLLLDGHQYKTCSSDNHQTSTLLLECHLFKTYPSDDHQTNTLLLDGLLYKTCSSDDHQNSTLLLDGHLYETCSSDDHQNSTLLLDGHLYKTYSSDDQLCKTCSSKITRTAHDFQMIKTDLKKDHQYTENILLIITSVHNRIVVTTNTES